MTGVWHLRSGPCAACGQTVLCFERFATTYDPGERVILDPFPTDDGDTILVNERPTRPAHPDDVRGRFPLYRSHFHSCPNHLVVPARHNAAR